MKRLVLAAAPYGDSSLPAAMRIEEGIPVEFDPLDGETSLVGRIYVGSVENTLNGLEAAFVRLDHSVKGYLPMKKARRFHPGEMVPVQVLTDAAKGKPPRLTDSLTLAGRYFVLSLEKKKTGVSGKLSGKERERLRETVSRLTGCMGGEPGYGILVRTQAASAAEEELAAELKSLKESFDKILLAGRTRTAGSFLYQPPGRLEQILEDFLRTAGEEDEIVAEGETLYQRCQAATASLEAGLAGSKDRPAPSLRLYSDPLLSLGALYSFRKTLDEILSPRVWLKSGAFLMIEQTEAFVSIDVNSGKCRMEKDRRDTLRRINLEAAAEIARQLRLRNLSGMILVDFIRMEREEDRTELLKELSRSVEADRIPCEVVDMTRLGIVEMTRKKIRPSVKEQLQSR